MPFRVHLLRVFSVQELCNFSRYSYIIFVNKGHNGWTGTKDDIFDSDNQALNDFVFATDLFQRVKQYVKSTRAK